MTLSRYGKPVKRRSGKALIAGLLSLLAVLASVPVVAGADNDRVGQVKAAFILNIAKFVGWPSGVAALSKPVFTLCYYREDILGSGVEIILNKHVLGRPLDNALIDSLEQSEGCGILLIPSSQLAQFVAESTPGDEREAILTIADLTSDQEMGIAHPGVIMNFVRRGINIGFEVNPAELKARHLSMSSELLKLARIIGGPGDAR